MAVSTPVPAHPLIATLRLLQQSGLHDTSDSTVAEAMGLTTAELEGRYPSRAALVTGLVEADIERQKRDHAAIYEQLPNAVDRLYGLLRYSINELLVTPDTYYGELQQGFPAAWEVAMSHLDSYSMPQIQQLLNDGIRQGTLRSDINIQLVSTIMLQQVNLLLNPQVFPPDRYNLSEVFRSIFLYYIRGICTDEGARKAVENFSRL